MRSYFGSRGYIYFILIMVGISDFKTRGMQLEWKENQGMGETVLEGERGRVKFELV